jgi:hypothetical protein
LQLSGRQGRDEERLEENQEDHGRIIVSPVMLRTA